MQGIHGQRMRDWDVHGVRDGGAGLCAGRGFRKRVLSYPREVQGCHWAGAAESWGARGSVGVVGAEKSWAG